MTALWRYKDTESVVKAMDGYTPGEGWVLYVPAQPAPAWRDAPTAPGIWLNSCDGHASRFDQRKIDSGSPGLAAGRWLGPLPEDTKCAARGCDGCRVCAPNVEFSGEGKRSLTDSAGT